MSRAKPVDNSATVSLFPFLAVLLCTMGALLVVLVAVTRTARNSALRRVEATEPPAVVEVDIESKKKLDAVNQFVSRLNQVKNEALEKLREDQQRLTHLEDHMRRLQDELAKLQIAAAEMEALEGEHYDDREQAEREVERLQQLIASTREAIDEIKKQQNPKKRAYALVPYEGPHGTTRRPIYVECREGELILQPEGVRITRDDLRPPLGTGNPLAAALRAARDYFIRQHPDEGRGRDTEPYPLIVVRPSGAAIYGIAQRAIQNSDFQFGYELVEEDWELKYPAADPQLAHIEQRAIDQARMRQEALEAAAPRAFRHPALAAAGRFEFGDGGASGAWGAGDGDADDAGDGGIPGAGGAAGGSDQHGLGGSGNAAGDTGGSNATEPGDDGTSSRQLARGLGDGNSQNPVSGNEGGHPDASVNGADSTGPTDKSTSRVAANAHGGTQSTSAGAEADARPGATSGGSAGGNQSAVQIQTGGDPHEMDLSASRGEDWALKRKKLRAVAVRRTIQVIVRNDQLAIVSDDVKSNAGSRARKTIPLQRDTVESIDEFVAAVQQQIDSWGMAGDGLYWRPVLSLYIGPDGQRRAQDLARLLKNSGFEVQPAAVANSHSGGNSRATRPR